MWLCEKQHKVALQCNAAQTASVIIFSMFSLSRLNYLVQIIHAIRPPAAAYANWILIKVAV